MTHTVYVHRHQDGRVLYVGCTANLRKRSANHKACALTESLWWPWVDVVETDSQWCDQASARRRERELIAQWCPVGNRQGNPMPGRGAYGATHAERKAHIEAYMRAGVKLLAGVAA